MKKINFILFLFLLLMPILVSSQQYSIINISDCRSNVTFTITQTNEEIDHNEYNITPNCVGDTTDNVWECACNTNYYLNTQINTLNKYRIRIEYESTTIATEESKSSGGSGGSYYIKKVVINTSVKNTTINTSVKNTTINTSVKNTTNTLPATVTVTQQTTDDDDTVTQPIDEGLPPLVLPDMTMLFIVIVIIILLFVAYRIIKKKRKKKVVITNVNDEIEKLYNDVNDIQIQKEGNTSAMGYCNTCKRVTRDIKSYVSKDLRCGDCGGYKKNVRN